MEKVAAALFLVACFNFFTGRDVVRRVLGLIYLIMALFCLVASKPIDLRTEVSLILFGALITIYASSALMIYTRGRHSPNLEDLDDFDD